MDQNILKSRSKIIYIIFLIITLIYGGFSIYLFYMQSIQPLDYDNRYFQSDLPYHISTTIYDGWYSFVPYINHVLLILGGQTTILIAIFLGVVSVAVIFVTEYAIRTFRNQTHGNIISYCGALIVNFVMPFYWEGASSYRYIGYQSGNIWHNSTYQIMKLFALASILVYFKMDNTYREGIKTKQWLLFMGLLAIGTAIKPSFLTVFAPVMAIKLIIDLFKKVPFKRVFIFGCTVLPSLVIALWQNGAMFGQGSGHSIAFDPWYTFSLHANRPKIAVICSVAFPAIVLLYTLWELIKDKKYLFIWVMAGVGFFEALCLVESGERVRDGNLLWGYYFCIFMLMLYAYGKWLETYSKNKGKILYKVVFILSGAVLAYQLWCGAYFFIRLLQGATYWMMR